jgi:hypothetical protein
MVSKGRDATALVTLGIVLLTAGCATIDGRPLWPLRIPPSRGDGPSLNDDLRKGIQAQFGFEVRDSEKRLLAHAEKPLGQLTWSTPLGVSSGHGGGWALYAFDDSFFCVHKGERYTIRVHYRPDPAFRASQGFVYLECGGSI